MPTATTTNGAGQTSGHNVTNGHTNGPTGKPLHMTVLGLNSGTSMVWQAYRKHKHSTSNIRL